MRKAIYPGSFDPITNGHVNIITRAVQLVDALDVIVSHNPQKQGFLTLEEKIQLIKEATAHLPQVNVVAGEKILTVEQAKVSGASIIVRGLRSSTDFEYERTMSMANKALNANIETIFLTADSEHIYLSSSMVKEIHQFSGDVTPFVPVCVKNFLDKKK